MQLLTKAIIISEIAASLLTSSAIKAEWDDVFKAANVNQSDNSKSPPPHYRKGLIRDEFQKNKTSEESVNESEILKQSSTGSWDDTLRHQKGVSESNHLSGQPKEVRQIFEKIAAIDNMLPDSSPEKAMMMCLFSQLFLQCGDFLSAEKICLKSLRHSERLTGRESYQTMACLNSLAKTYKYLGDYENEINCILAAYAILLKNPELPAGVAEGPNAMTQESLSCGLLAMLSEAQLEVGFITQAKENADKSLLLARSTSCDAETKAAALLANAKYFQTLGEIQKAETLLKEALNLIEVKYLSQPGISDQLESKNPDPLFYYKNKNANPTFASFYIGILNDLAAIELFNGHAEVSHGIVEKLRKVMKFEEAGSRGGTIGSVCLDEFQSILAELEGRHDEASQISLKNLQNKDRFLSSALDLTESQRLAWQRDNLNFTLPIQFCAPTQLAEYVLRWKGVVLDSLIIDRSNLRATEGVAVNKSLRELMSLKQRLAQIESSSQTGNEAKEYNKKVLRDRIALLERSMAQKAGVTREKTINGISLAAVKNTMSADTALIEFLAFRKFPDLAHGTAQLGALIIKKDRDPEWVLLGECRSVQLAVEGLIADMKTEKANDDPLTSDLNNIYRLVWEPLLSKLGNDVQRVIISPDGPVSFVPFASLLSPDGRFLSERFIFSEVGSGRDLLRSAEPGDSETMCVIANPAFSSSIALSNNEGDELVSRSINWSQLGKVSFSPLPGTEKEAVMIGDEAAAHGVSTTILMSQKATKSTVLGLKASKILHIATHGFYCEDGTACGDPAGVRGMTLKKVTEDLIPSAKLQSSARVLNPMQQSGLALAGAEDTIRLWQAGKQTDPSNDGILTAEEVAGLDLNGTWLVTLSACETAVGQVQSGEGVFGLRRAFMMAGAQNLLMTLWPVSDEVTPMIMADFYKEALTTHDAAGSLAKIQRDWLVKLRKEKGLLFAVRDAGAFVIAATGKQASTSPPPSSTSTPIPSPQAPANSPIPTVSPALFPVPPAPEQPAPVANPTPSPDLSPSVTPVTSPAPTPIPDASPSATPVLSEQVSLKKAA